MFRGTREGWIDRGFRLGIGGLVFAILVTAANVLSVTPAAAAGDGINTQLANELRALSAANTQSAPKKSASTTKKKPGKKAVASKSTAGKKVKLSGKGQKVAKRAKKRKGGTKVASIGAFVPGQSVKKSLIKKGGKFKGNVSWRAPSGCVPGALKSVLYQVSQKFGPVVVNSSFRSRRHNRRVGGARASWHLRCMAVDFRVLGSHKGLWAFLRSHPSVGGLKRYPLGFLHIDTGPKRTW